MTAGSLVQVGIYLLLVLLLVKPLGGYMARVFQGERTFLEGGLGWLERGTYRLLGVDPKEIGRAHV